MNAAPALPQQQALIPTPPGHHGPTAEIRGRVEDATWLLDSGESPELVAARCGTNLQALARNFRRWSARPDLARQLNTASQTERHHQ